MRDRFSTYYAPLSAAFSPSAGSTAGLRPRAEAAPLLYPYFIYLFSFLFILLFSSSGWAATASGTKINNVATATYISSVSGTVASSASNTASVTTTVSCSPATIELLQYAPSLGSSQATTVRPTSYSPGGSESGPFVLLPAPVSVGTGSLNLSAPLPLAPATMFHEGDPVFIRITDLDKNNDPFTAETIVVTVRNSVTGDSKVLQLRETGPNTGVFTGYVQTGTQPGATSLYVTSNSSIDIQYADVCNGSSTAVAASALIDPYGLVFSSATGLPVNNASVTLINVATGQPATVYGDDGFSSFPATVTTGGTAQDSSGKAYTFTPGNYRFPYINPGTYKFVVTPPAGYRAPSSVDTAALQALPGAPFVIVSPGSRGETFVVNPGPAIHIDIPVDPMSSRLYLVKSARKDTVAAGDFVPYSLRVENLDTIASVGTVSIIDRLPSSFRYRKGSAKLDGAPLADPAVSEDGRTLTFAIGDLAAGAKKDVTYIAEVGVGIKPGKATNTAVAMGAFGASSNTAWATVTIIEDLFRSKTTIVGQVFDRCGEGRTGVPGVRIFMEDGTYVITDKNGMYHFAAVTPGTHVVQVDTITIPDQYDPVPCEENTRFAGTAFSQFVDIMGGMLWRADFHLEKRPPREKQAGEVGLELRSALASGLTASDTSEQNSRYKITYAVPAVVGPEAVKQLRLVVALPEGAAYTPGSSKLGTEWVADPSIESNILTYPLGDRIADWEGTVRFEASVPASREVGGLTTRAHLVFSSPGSALVSAQSMSYTLFNPSDEALVSAQTISMRTDPNSRYEINYAVPMHVGAVPVQKLRLVVLLPDGAVYTPGSSRLNAGQIADPFVMEGVLTYRLGDQPAGWNGTVRFDAAMPAAGSVGELETKAYLLFDTPDAKGEKTPLVDNLLVRHTRSANWAVPDVVLHPRFDTFKANLSARDMQDVEQAVTAMRSMNLHHVTFTGHTDSNKIRPGASKEFPDNYALSRARAKTVADVIAKRLHLSPSQITILGKGPDEPVTGNETAEGRALNRRVEIQVQKRTTATWTEIRSKKESSGMKAVATLGLPEGETWPPQPAPGSRQTATAASKAMPDYDSTTWMNTAQPGTAWLWPLEGQRPSIASTSIAVKHDPALKARLTLNNAAVDPMYFEGAFKKADSSLAVSVWRAINLADGDNRFEITLVDASGTVVERLNKTLHYSGTPAKVVLLPERSRLIADGRTPSVIAIRVLDKEGHPAREGVRADYILDPPYMPQQRAEGLQAMPLTAPDTSHTRYLIGEDGVALIELAPTMQTGEAVLRFTVADGTQELRTWIKPEKRDWILVGLAEGTVGYNVVKGNMETAAASGGDDKFYEDDRVAFYAKGQIKGEWLLTLAYDSKKANADGKQAMYQAIDPNKYYTLYGDATAQQNDAQSARHLYVKLERDQFYALFGDYNTGLSVTELSRYSRSLTGIKSELKTEHFDYTAFVSDTNQAYVRDEIPGDGTSGLYRLSRKNIVLNSEKITIVTRDRFHSEVILSSQQMSRFMDYSIDYDSGTIFFKAPVFSRDNNFNPNTIVVEYESFDDSDKSYNYGGRAAVKALNNKVEVGATHVHEGSLGATGNLEGADTKIKLTDKDTLRAEVATTKTSQAGTDKTGSAYLAELQHRSDTLEGKAYVREQTEGFGLGQQGGSETGTRKMGADVATRLGKSWTVGGEIYRQETLLTGAIRDMAELRTGFTSGRYNLLGGIRRSEDSLITGETYRSDQVFGSLQYQATDRTTVRIKHDQSLGSNNNIDFPTRTSVGADYRFNKDSALFADQEWTKGRNIRTENTRVGIRTSPWTGGQLGSTMEQQATENGVRLFSTTGLKQSWQINENWTMDAGLDRSMTIRNTGAYTTNPNVPAASGSSEDFTAVSLGAGYKQEKWSWTGRAEQRHSETEDKVGIFTGANGEVKAGLGLAAGLQLFKTDNKSGLEAFNSDLRVSLAYRPAETRVIVLDRLDYILNDQHGGTVLSDKSWRLINNAVANFKKDSKTQISVQYAVKYIQEIIDQSAYHGFTDLAGIEGRYDFTKKVDFGVRGSVLHSWNLHQVDYLTAASVGFNAGRNIWVSLGYNFTGFKDKDFSRADFTSEGPFIKMRMKFDQASVRDAVKWFGGQ